MRGQVIGLPPRDVTVTIGSDFAALREYMYTEDRNFAVTRSEVTCKKGAMYWCVATFYGP